MMEFHTRVFPSELIDRRQGLIGRDTTFTSLFADPRARWRGPASRNVRWAAQVGMTALEDR